MSSMENTRRLLIIGAATSLALPGLATQRRALATMTEGPFYPPRAWRDSWPDQDADLSRVRRGGEVLSAQGEHLGLELVVADANGRLIDGADVELWQCDAMAQYRHPSVAARAGGFDPGFQGYGATRSGAQGQARLRSIKPVAYPGRTPHIHFTLRHPSFGTLTSQLFVAGDPGNAGDFLWRRLPPADRDGLTLNLQAATPDDGLRWRARHTLVVPA
jgi:protocatechuate 3,4-dioxygenase, beta subunit